MIIYGRREYGILFVTIMLSIFLRGLVDIKLYNISPYSRDLINDIWLGKFLSDSYWRFILVFFSLFGYVWGKICGGHVKVICKRDEIEKGTLCYRILGF